MAAASVRKVVSPDEYLRRESEAEMRSEFWDGVVLATAGSAPEHDYVSDHLHLVIGSCLRNDACRAFRTMSVHIPAYNLYIYPDLSVACSPKFTRIHGIGVLVNPILVVEVLSESTTEVDLTAKKEGYASLDSLALYLVASQDEPRVELFVREANGAFRTELVAHDLDAVVPLDAIGCEVTLRDAYRGVTFDQE